MGWAGSGHDPRGSSQALAPSSVQASLVKTGWRGSAGFPPQVIYRRFPVLWPVGGALTQSQRVPRGCPWGALPALGSSPTCSDRLSPPPGLPQAQASELRHGPAGAAGPCTQR